jgi:hypothetical protein
MHTHLIHIFIHLVVCITRGPKPLPKRPLHLVRSRASSFKLEYPLLSLRSSSSFLRLLPRLPVTSTPSFIFPSITSCRRQFLHKIWPIQLAFRLPISYRIFLCSLTLSYTSFLTWSVQLIFSIFLRHHIFKTFHVSLIYCPKRPSKRAAADRRLRPGVLKGCAAIFLDCAARKVIGKVRTHKKSFLY